MYYRKDNDFEYICYQNATLSYPVHTYARHITIEEGKSVTEVAYATGFCDQSHFDRCFHKIVGLTPNEYKQSVKRLA